MEDFVQGQKSLNIDDLQRGYEIMNLKGVSWKWRDFWKSSERLLNLAFCKSQKFEKQLQVKKKHD